nr:pathogenesis-related protein 2a [Allium sativum]
MARNHIVASAFSALVLLGLFLGTPTRVESIGVCYGMLGDNLPLRSEVVDLYRSNKIEAMRIYSADNDALQALKNLNVQLLMDVGNDQLQTLASNLDNAKSWIQSNVVSNSPAVSFRYIAVGNEVIPEIEAQYEYVLPAMQNIQAALSQAGLGHIKVSTSVSMSVLHASSPPSAGEFSPQLDSTLRPLIKFLADNDAPFLLNVYPYFAYSGGKGSIPLDFALFTSSGAVVNDGQYHYQNLFDAMVDALYSALEKMGASKVPVVVSESGWPSAGGDPAVTNKGNAQTYNQNLIKHVGNGTPKRPGTAIETFLFAMFNENQKHGDEIERNFGLFYPSKEAVYQLNFT